MRLRESAGYSGTDCPPSTGGTPERGAPPFFHWGWWVLAGRPRKRVGGWFGASGLVMGSSAHDSNCRCPRCTGFLPGNQLALGRGRPESHGAYSRSLVKLAPVVEERAAAIRELLPVFHPVDEVAVRALAIVLIRIERAEAALELLEAELEEAGGDALAMYGEELSLNGRVVRVDGLKDDLARWVRAAEKWANALGATPLSRARLGLDLIRSQRLTVLDLHREAGEEIPPAVTGQ